MTQSRNIEITKIFTPQFPSHIDSEKFTTVLSGDAEKRREIGYSMGLILQNSYCKFKIISSQEKLYRYKINPDTGKEVECAVFRRVHCGDCKRNSLDGLRSKEINGKHIPFCGIHYDICALLTEKNLIRGYAVYARNNFDSSFKTCSERILYILEQKTI